MVVNYSKAVTVIIAAIGLFCTHTAMAQELDKNKAIPKVSASAVRAIADADGLKSNFSRYKDERVLVVESRGNLKTLVRFVGCDDKEALTQCDGMELRALWRYPDTLGAASMNKLLSDFNVAFRAAKVGHLDGKQLYLSRYIIADYGTNQGNIALELSVFGTIAEKFRATIFGR